MVLVNRFAVMLSMCMLFSACPVGGELTVEPGFSMVTYRFVVENQSSAETEIHLQLAEALWGEFYQRDFPRWVVISRWQVPPESPDYISTPFLIPANEGVELRFDQSVRFYRSLKAEMSFLLTIDGRHYAGWPENLGSGRDVILVDGNLNSRNERLDAVQWGLGNASFATPYNDWGWVGYLPDFASVLSIPDHQHDTDSRLSGNDLEIVYRVTVSDDGIEFTIDAIYVSPFQPIP